MTDKKARKSPKPSFGTWEAPPSPEGPAAARLADYAGLAPDKAAAKLQAALARRRDLRPVTVDFKAGIVRRTLQALAERKLDLANATPNDMAAYREYLRALVAEGHMAESYAAAIARHWNATLRAVFGKEGAASLTMRGFREAPKVVRVLSAEEMTAVRNAIQAAPPYRLGGFRTEHHKAAFYAYYALATSTGCRYESAHQLRAADFDWENGRVRFRHMKNRADHVVRLSPFAARVLREWAEHLQVLPFWAGPETRVFVDPNGTPLSCRFINQALARCGRAAGLGRALTSHTIRKSVGTFIARTNPKFGALQLGITDRIFNKHYNQPTPQDLDYAARLLPDLDDEPRGPGPEAPERRFLPQLGMKQNSGYV